MLDVSLESVSARLLRGITLQIAGSSHTALTGIPGCGASTLLRVIAGVERPDKGRILFGAHDVTRLSYSRRPVLHVTGELDVPGRWSVEHALVNAVRTRSLDRVDRYRELRLAVEKWSLDAGRTIRSLSDSERARVHLARIELRKPAILLADRLLRDVPDVADEWYRTLRVLGTTTISAPASRSELGWTDRVVVLDSGTVAQSGTAAEVFNAPVSLNSASATGAVNALPVVVRGNEVESPIGNWRVAAPAFQGKGSALFRPEALILAAAGEESDLIFNVEEASFDNGRWMASGLVTGAINVRVSLDPSQKVFKGRLLPLRFDPARITLIPEAPSGV